MNCERCQTRRLVAKSLFNSNQLCEHVRTSIEFIMNLRPILAYDFFRYILKYHKNLANLNANVNIFFRFFIHSVVEMQINRSTAKTKSLLFWSAFFIRNVNKFSRSVDIMNCKYLLPMRCRSRFESMLQLRDFKMTVQRKKMCLISDRNGIQIGVKKGNRLFFGLFRSFRRRWKIFQIQ